MAAPFWRQHGAYILDGLEVNMERNMIPCSPFTTRLTGGGRETELRLRGMFQWNRGRPPALLAAGAVLVILLSGTLVSCGSQEGTAVPPQAGMLTELNQRVELEHLLGYGGYGVKTLDESGEEQYTYTVELPGGRLVQLPGGSGGMWHGDVDGDGALEVVTAEGKVYRRWPDGSIRAQDLRQAAVALEGTEGVRWWELSLSCRPEEDTVVVQPMAGMVEKAPSAPAVELPLSQLLDQAHGGTILVDANLEPVGDDVRVCFLERLDLDGQGGFDDRAVLTAGDEVGQNSLEVTLGTGAVLTWSLPDWISPRLLAGYLVSDRYQSLVLELVWKTSNYLAADYWVLSVRDGTLVEEEVISTDMDMVPQAVMGGTLETGDGGLQVLRIPVHVSRWHDVGWATLRWTDGQARLVLDETVTDHYALPSVDGQALLLALRFPLSSEGENEIRVYDRVDILEEGNLLQTITADQISYGGTRSFMGFLADDVPQDSVVIRDLDGDGRWDFGLRCDSVDWGSGCWFVWAQELGQYRFLDVMPRNQWENLP